MELTLRDVLDIAGAIIVGLLTVVWRNLNGEVKVAKELAAASVPRREFTEYITTLDAGRKEFRESLSKLFERTEQHERRDEEAFRNVTRDFTSGMNSLRDAMFQNTREILTELNGKEDRRS